ncbi:TetR/AcrR family transcriptional regulator [Cognatishimia activa]|uniref:Putative acrEF/envCD operon repressor n=1 Tax=Cognatishimia activa TaxID=1715691 RepID=A0A0P1IMR5_9RHOB|nr:TetR/AcrR family transcriptional regulator [Cognatishimia activa]CUJ13545.1 putative acrEF/envCD operon repressor [Cognatishimia activa]CUK24965.1 putative acrEF/envCD operon repressor [Cognatishimia activa]
MNDSSGQDSVKNSQIVEAATAEFLENGFANASMDRISARAEVSKRTVYKHFESKENLFRELIRRHLAKFTETVNVTYDKDRDIREQLLDLARAEGTLLTSEEVMLTTRLVMSEILRRPDLVEKTQEKTDFKAAFVNLLRKAAEDDKLRIEDANAAADEFLALIKGKAFWPVVFGAPVVSEEEMARIVENSVDMMMSRYAV